MSKKMTKEALSEIKTDDPAFRQMLENLPNIDIDPYASEKGAKEETEADDDKEEAGAPAASTERRRVRRSSSKTAPAKATTFMPISESGRDSLNLAKQLYCRHEGVKMTREEFLLLMTEKALKKLSPKAYERWKLFEDIDGQD